ncbi:MAG: phosphatidylserine decarboxylase family protein [Alistipes sp.]|nr:phosphatidylserine decarboxylase family protein [Alistipes sp.]
MKINKEGYKIIFITGLLCLAMWGVIYYLLRSESDSAVMWLSGIVLIMFWFFIVSFFREPRRVKIHDNDLIFAPCDGRVVVTERVIEDEYLGGREMLQISIFMSITNVHINWFPVGGTVKYFKYHPGRFLVAWHPKSSTENERTTTVVETENGDIVMFRQIAGVIARRIVSYMKEGKHVKQNDICGFIKFGSRIDLLIPKESELLVEIGDPVTGTQTPLARLRSSNDEN